MIHFNLITVISLAIAVSGVSLLKQNGTRVNLSLNGVPDDYPVITGLKVETDVPESDGKSGINLMKADTRTTIRIFGKNLNNRTLMVFTDDKGIAGEDCSNMEHSHLYQLFEVYSDMMATIEVDIPETETPKSICVRQDGGDAKWYHQGSEPWLMLEAEGKLLPMGLQIIVVVILHCLTGLFAGLNLGLMSLDKNELRVIAKCGTDTEKRYAKVIEPLRRRGNYLLCTILLSNVSINATVTVFLEELTGSGFIAVAVATVSIVIFGDIVPQAICTRHGLAVGAKTVYITYLFMLITFPVSYPISKVLDWVLGEEIGQVYDRQKLMEFIILNKDYSQLANTEVNMITGALYLKTKTASEVMTRLEDVFMLSLQSILDFDMISQIQKQGYSRIPVYDEDRKNIVALFHAKDLAFVDPDDKMPLQTLIGFYKHPLIYTNEATTLDLVLEEFKNGRSHLAFVRQFYDNGDEDPFYEVIGVVTLEDVIEEIIQAEIVDETDILSDNRRKRKRKDVVVQDFSEFQKIAHHTSPDPAPTE
ncbi:Metal transporter CNNM2 [Halotydeus destructor]|nr:Metal transporter CNNM2 [Halotydeus destructor]